jgi:RNA polymerase sigma-70 factor, ECF subfamily
MDFETMYRKHHPFVYKVLNKKTFHNKQELVEDLVQEVFIKAFENYDGFNQNKANVKTWLFTIAKNTLIDYFRSRRYKLKNNEEEISVDYEITHNEGYLKFVEREEINQIHALINTLKGKQRKAIILFYLKEKTIKEVSELMDISVTNVKVLMHRARNKMKTTCCNIAV